MKLIDLKVKNFMPYKGEQFLKFPTDPSANILVVYGDNMRGKTSLLNAIRWGFYGTAYSRHMATIGLDKIVNIEAAQSGDWNVAVEINFEANGNQYHLIRSASKKSHISKPSGSMDFDQTVYLKKNGSLLSAHQVEPEINLYAPEQVSRFFLFDGELLQEYEMLLDEASASGVEIKKAIEQVLGVPALINGRDEAQTLLKNAQKTQNKEITKINEMSLLAEKQRKLQEQDDSKERDIEASKLQLKQIREEKATLDDELEALNRLSTIANELDNKKKDRKRVLDEQETLKQEFLSVASSAWKDLLRPKLILEQDRLLVELQKKTDSFSRSGALQLEINQVKSIINLSTCPTCQQDVSDTYRLKYEDRLKSLEETFSTLSSDKEALVSVSSKLQALSTVLKTTVQGTLQQINKKIRQNDIEITRLENSIDILGEQLQGHESGEINRKRKYHDSLISSETKLEATIENLESERSKIRRQSEALTREIGANPMAKNSRATILSNTYAALESIFKDSIDVLRERLKVEVEKNATEAFLSLTTQKLYSGLKINDGYGLKILDENQNEVPLRSAGAEQIVALSLIDGLSRTGRKAGPVVMDTPFGRLDPKHRENILNYLPTKASQLVLLVHAGEIDRNRDLKSIAHRVGAEYEIREVNTKYSLIERLS